MNGTLVVNSLMLSGGVAMLAVVLGFCFALAVACLPSRGRWTLCGLAAIALMMPPFFVTSVWMELLGNEGIVSNWLPIRIYSLPGAAFVLALLTWPVPGILFLISMTGLPRHWFDEEPYLAGFPMIRHGLFPQLLGVGKLAGIIVFTMAFTNFSVPALLQVKVFPAELWIQFNTTFDFVAAFKMSWPILLVAMLAVLLVFNRGFPFPSHQQDAIPHRMFRARLGWSGALFVSLAAAGLLVASLGLPMMTVLFDPQTWQQLPGAFKAGTGAIANTLKTAGCVGLIAVWIAAGLWKFRAGSLSWLLYWIPGIVLGIAAIYGLNRPMFHWLYPSFLVVCGLLTLRYLAIAWSGVRLAFRSVPTDQMEEARLNGASHWQQIVHVLMPQTRNQIAGVGYLVYLLCLWDVETILMVLPPGGETLAIRIFNLLHYGHNQEVNALSLILFGLALFPLPLYFAGLRVGEWWSARSMIQGSFRSVGLGGFMKWSTMGGGALLLVSCSNATPELQPLDDPLFSHVRILGRQGAGAGEFNKPRSVVVDAQDNLYVVDMTGRVQKFSPQGDYLLAWQMPQIDRGKPKGMCRDLEGNIVIVEPHYARVNHFSPQGELAAQWGESGGAPGQLTLPRAAAVNSRGELFTSEYSVAERIQKFDGPQGRWVQAWGEAGDGEGQFNRPEGLGIDASDRLYVADSCNHRLQVFDSNGNFIATFGQPGTGAGEMSYPYDVKIDSHGRIFVCEFGNSRIQVFDENYQSLGSIGGPGSAAGRFSNPWSIAFDSHYNLYVADSMNHRVQKLIARSGAFRKSDVRLPADERSIVSVEGKEAR